MTIALELKNLKKTYESGVVALRGIDLVVEQGDFYALLGPNGAGKSTTIGIVTSLVNKTAGTVKVFGYDLDTDLVQNSRSAWCHRSLTLIHLKPSSRLSSIRLVTTVFHTRKPWNAVKNTSGNPDCLKSAMNGRGCSPVG